MQEVQIIRDGKGIGIVRGGEGDECGRGVLFFHKIIPCSCLDTTLISKRHYFSYKHAVLFFHSTQKLIIHQRALTLLHVTSASLDCLLLFCPLLGDSALRWVSSPLWLFLADTDFLPGDLLPLEPFPADLVLAERDSCLFLYI